ncbi:diguanylate cyclase [uncultured Oscillibacter sp.]|uniref:diguanylate cyclase domain-containing protein n=2 Tax=Oscillibacter TaxID=459786 RepID=UPI002626D208|nr:diguanylate cyclase [uncultured Oscillibacter sp.]
MDHLEEILRKGLRRGDAAARCGADQFVLLLPQADYDASRAVCARLVRNFTRRYPHSPLRVTFFVQPLPPGGTV